MSTTFEVSDVDFPDRLLAEVRVTVGQISFPASLYLNGDIEFEAALSEPLRGAVAASVRKYVLDSLRRRFAARDALDARETRAEEFTQHAQRPPEFGTGGAA